MSNNKLGRVTLLFWLATVRFIFQIKVFVTGNANKLREVKAILGDSSGGFTSIDLDSRDLDSRFFMITVRITISGSFLLSKFRSYKELLKKWHEKNADALQNWYDLLVCCRISNKNFLIHNVQQVGGPCITEDVALCFKAMNDLPGPYIKHFLKALGPAGKFLIMRNE